MARLSGSVVLGLTCAREADPLEDRQVRRSRAAFRGEPENIRSPWALPVLTRPRHRPEFYFAVAKSGSALIS